ncbi:MAG: hypothetical protein AB7D57_07165, partial [Desulfovibrionaceae bacterium]
LMVDMLPGAFAGLPGWLAPVFSSSLSAATVLAVVLNLCFRIGVASKAVLELERGGEPTWEVVAFMQRQGGAWGARPDVVNRASQTLLELVEAVLMPGGTERLHLEVRFDEFNLDIVARWEGAALELPLRRLDPGEVFMDDKERRFLAGWMIRRIADRVTLAESGGVHRLNLHFNH